MHAQRSNASCFSASLSATSTVTFAVVTRFAKAESRCSRPLGRRKLGMATTTSDMLCPPLPPQREDAACHHQIAGQNAEERDERPERQQQRQCEQDRYDAGAV